MKLTIFGATGSVGRELVNQALSAGHAVTVLVRNPYKLGDVSSRVSVVRGDVTESAAVEQAVKGADAVLSALGHTKGSPPDLFSTAMGKVISAMRQHGVHRLVVLSNTALSDAEDQPTFGQRLTRGFMGMAMAQMNKDHIAQARLIAESGLDWTIVRAAMLSDGPRSGKYQAGKLDTTASSSISRTDVADFMLACATSQQYLRSMPVLSQRK